MCLRDIWRQIELLWRRRRKRKRGEAADFGKKQPWTSHQHFEGNMVNLRNVSMNNQQFKTLNLVRINKTFPEKYQKCFLQQITFKTLNLVRISKTFPEKYGQSDKCFVLHQHEEFHQGLPWPLHWHSLKIIWCRFERLSLIFTHCPHIESHHTQRAFRESILSKLQLSWLVTTFVNNMNRREIGVNFLCLHSEAIKTLSPQRDVGSHNFQHIVNSKLSCPRRTMGGGAFWEDPFQPVHTRLKSFLHIHFQEEEEEK